MTRQVNEKPYFGKLKKISNPAFYGALGALAMLAPANIAFAQDAGSVESTTLEEVVVTGIRGSLISSLNAKRNSDAIIDVITAEDIGKFPDKNLAEAIQRIPGVTIARDFGEGERVSIRGSAPNLTRTQLNGHSLATADWFVLDQLSANRSFNYLILPSDIVQQVKVYKSPQASVEEGGIGGVVDAITRKPLEQRANSGALKVDYSFSELSDESDPSVSGLYSWKNDDETFGVLVSGTRQERNIRRDSVETLAYDSNVAGFEGLAVPTLIGSALFEQERIRTTGNVVLQWRPSDKVEVNLNYLYSEFEGSNSNDNFLTFGNNALGGGGSLTNAVVEDGIVVAGTIASANNGTEGFGVVFDTFARDATAETDNIDFNVIVEFTDRPSGSFRVGNTTAFGNTDNQPFIELGGPASYNFDIRGRAPTVSFNNIDPNNPQDVRPIFASLHEILTDDEEDYAYADFNLELDHSLVSSVDFGLKYTDHLREVRFNATTYGGFFVPINSTAVGVFSDGGGSTPSDFLDGISGSGVTSFFRVNQQATTDFLFDNLANATAAGNGRIPYPQQNLRIDEEVFGGYVQANISTEKWRGNVGVRIVKTETTSQGAQISPTGAVSNAFGSFDSLSIESDYTDVLPSLNLTYDINDQWLARFAAAKVITRPNFTDLAPRSSLNPGTLTGVSGNPDLDPFEANQFDVSVEYYPSEGTSYAAAVFYKDVSNFVTNNFVTQILPVQTSTPASTACVPSSTSTTQNPIFDCPFQIDQRVNGEGGSIFGIELAALVPLGDNFGVQANYTYVDSEDDGTGLPLPGTSKNSLNASVFYEDERFSAKVAYTWRDDFFVTVDRGVSLSQEATGFVEASLAYNITENVTLTLEGVNLTDETIREFGINETQHRNTRRNGRVFYAGVRWAF
ncbi:MAG: TonB-dependent receptor [Arenicella sp.]|nr:TonB-dependent receptor [Arenicella sp.]